MSELSQIIDQPPFSERTAEEQRDLLVARIAAAEAKGNHETAKARKASLLAFLRANTDADGNCAGPGGAPAFETGDEFAGSEPDGDNTSARRGGGGAKDGGGRRRTSARRDPVNDPSLPAYERLRAAAGGKW